MWPFKAQRTGLEPLAYSYSDTILVSKNIKIKVLVLKLKYIIVFFC